MGYKPSIFLTLGMFSFALLNSSNVVFADGMEKTEMEKGSKSDWSFKIGVGAGYSPDYEGSDDYEVQALPLLDVTWRDTVSVGTMDGPGIKVKALQIEGPTPQDNLTLTTSLGYFMGRDEDDNDALKGFGDIDGGVTAGVNLEYGIRQFVFETGIEHDLSGDRDGTVLNAGLKYRMMLGPKQTKLSVGPEISWASDDYMQSMFGISNSQASNSTRGYSAYDAGAGIKDIGVTATMMHSFTENISLMSQVGYTQLTGDAADSPIVKNEGDEKQFSAMFGLVYSW